MKTLGGAMGVMFLVLLTGEWTAYASLEWPMVGMKPLSHEDFDHIAFPSFDDVVFPEFDTPVFLQEDPNPEKQEEDVPEALDTTLARGEPYVAVDFGGDLGLDCQMVCERVPHHPITPPQAEPAPKMPTLEDCDCGYKCRKQTVPWYHFVCMAGCKEFCSILGEY